MKFPKFYLQIMVLVSLEKLMARILIIMRVRLSKAPVLHAQYTAFVYAVYICLQLSVIIERRNSTKKFFYIISNKTNLNVFFHYTCGFIKQGRQCTHNVILRRFRATIVAVDTTCVNLQPKYPACNVHAPYCPLWPALYLINGKIFEKKKLLRT